MSYSDDDEEDRPGDGESSFLTEEDEDDDNPEMLTLNLAFGNKNDTIQVHWNDDPEDLAKIFVKKHGLKPTSVGRIRDHISSVVNQYKLENSELRPQSPTLDQSFDDEDEADKQMKDQYRQPHEQHKAIEPLDLPLPSKESPGRSEVMTTPRREIRLSASTIDMPSSRTISTVTNPEYEPDPHSHRKQQRITDHRGNRGNEDSGSEQGVGDEEEKDDEDSSRRQVTDTEISRILSRALSQEHEDPEGDRAFASQYLESILRSGSHMDSRGDESPPDSENLSDSFHAPTNSSGDSQIREEEAEEREVREGESEERGSSDRGDGDDDEEHLLGEAEEEEKRRERVDGHTTLTPQHDFTKQMSSKNSLQQLFPEADTPGYVEDDVESEISEGSGGGDDHETILDLSHSFEETRIDPAVNANMYDRIKRNWVSGGGKKKSSDSFGNFQTMQSSSSAATVTPSRGKLRNTIIFSKSPLSSQPPLRKTNPTVDRAADRLLNYGETIEKRKEWKRNQLLREEKNEMEANQFKLSRKSRQVTRHISYANKSSNVNERLYEEGVKKQEKKDKIMSERVEEMKTELTSWSCVQCGTFHELDSTARKNLLSGLHKLKCSSCGAEGSTSSPLSFHPTNIAPLRSSKLEHRRAPGEGIHNHLYANSSQQSKRVQLLQKMWGQTDQDNTFCPAIPKGSKQILEKHQKRKGQGQEKLSRDKEEISSAHTTTSNSSIPERNCSSSSSSGKTNLKQQEEEEPKQKKVPMAQTDLDEYLSLPVTERLTLAEHFCRKGNSSEKSNHDPPRIKRKQRVSSAAIEEEIDARVNRLAYEYVDKEAKRQAAEEQLRNYDPRTNKKYFTPTIPSSSRRINPVIISKEEPIHEKLLRKGKDHEKSIQQLKQKLETNEQHQLHLKKHRSLARSLTILQESFQHSNEEIFKLLLAHQQIAKKEDDPGNQLSRKSSPEKLTQESRELSDWESHPLDIRSVDPKLLSKDIRDVISVVKTDVLKRAQQKQEKRLQTCRDESEISSKEKASWYLVDFPTFQSLMESALKRTRDGPGKSYLVAPKPRGEVTKALLEREKNEISFHPTLDPQSIALAKRRGRASDKSIVDILINEGEYSKKQAQKAKERIDSEAFKDCSFKPQLFPTPRNIIPTYRGQPKIRMSSTSMADPNISSINVSYQQSCSMFTPGRFTESLHFAATERTNGVENPLPSSSSPSKPITIARLSDSNIAKALLSYDQHDDDHLAISDSEYNETEEIDSTTLPDNELILSPLHNREGRYFHHDQPSTDMLNEGEEEREERRDSSPPPPPFSILTSSFTINDLKTPFDDQVPPPPPPSTSSVPPPPYRYSSFGDIESSAKSPQQQSVIQRIESFRSK